MNLINYWINDMPYEVFAIADNGDGYVQSLGVYDEVEDISIRTDVLAPHVLITVNAARKKED